MNFIKHLAEFFERIQKDNNIRPVHMQLYFTLFMLWNRRRFVNPLAIARHDVMLKAKIHGKGTYHKAIRNLHDWGYIIYSPSNDPSKKSTVFIIEFDKTEVQNMNQYNNLTSSKTGTNQFNFSTELVQKLIPYNKHISKHSDKQLIYKGDDKKFDSKKEKIKIGSSSKIEQAKPFVPPKLEAVKIFFSEKEKVEEAERFFNYYESKGWLVGGKAAMKDWEAAARNWILNTKKIVNNGTHKSSHQANHKAGRLHTTSDKDYNEPL